MITKHDTFTTDTVETTHTVCTVLQYYFFLQCTLITLQPRQLTLHYAHYRSTHQHVVYDYGINERNMISSNNGNMYLSTYVP